MAFSAFHFLRHLACISLSVLGCIFWSYELGYMRGVPGFLSLFSVYLSTSVDLIYIKDSPGDCFLIVYSEETKEPSSLIVNIVLFYLLYNSSLFHLQGGGNIAGVSI